MLAEMKTTTLKRYAFRVAILIIEVSQMLFLINHPIHRFFLLLGVFFSVLCNLIVGILWLKWFSSN